MTFFLHQTLTGLTHAMGLFLVASGLSLIFGVSRIINFAHGSLFMLGAYAAATFAETLPAGAAGYYGGLLAASLVVGLVGGLVEVLLLRRIYRAPELYQLLLTFALVLVIGDAVRFLWGPENRLGPLPPGLDRAVPILGQGFPAYDLALLGLGPAVAGGLWWLLHRTRVGVLIRAATADREMVAALGVNERWLFTGVFVLGSWLAGLAGALQMPRQALTTVMDSGVIAEAFVVVVVGGMGSPFGALLGAVLIGLLQAYGILWLPREFHLVLVFLLMATVLVLRPHGLLGRPLAPAAMGPACPTGGGEGGARVPAWAALLLGGLLLGLPPLLPDFALWLLAEALAFSLAAGSLQLLLGTGGLLSFGHAAYFGLGAYGAALWMQSGGLPMPAALLLGPATALLAALVIGSLSVRSSGVYFAMLTLAFAQIAYAVVHQWYDFTGGDNGLLGIWPSPGLASPLRYYYLALLAAGVGLLLLRRITGSPFGLTLRAARDHPLRCGALGVDLRRHQLLAFTLAGAFAGLGGALYAFLKGSVFPDYLAIPVSVELLVMVLLGGMHTLLGAPVGAAAYLGLNTAITIATDYWQAVLGGVLVLLVLVFPRGILGIGGRP